MTDFKKYMSILLTGILIRVWLLNDKLKRDWFQSRLEISTPLTSWNRVLEGIYLKNQIGLSSTYEGDLVHELPLMLMVYEFLIRLFGSKHICYLLVCLDALNAVLIHQITKKFVSYLIALESVNKTTGKYVRLFQSKSAVKKDLDEFFLTESTFNPEFWSFCAFSMYLLNIFSISSCVALSTVIIHNLILLIWLYCLMSNQTMLSFLILALHTNISVYSINLFTASVCFLYQKENYIDTNGKIKYESFKQMTLFVIRYLFIFVLFLAVIFGFNLYLENFNTRFIDCTYLFILKVPDLLPNLGLFWYFFTEMFDHFRTFFTYVFQLNAFIYAIPLTIRLRNDPIVNLILQISLLTILKSYPNVGETGFYLSLLMPLLGYLFKFMRNFLVYSCMLLFSTALAPVMLYLWLGSGGGNANFYFAITIVYSVGQLFLIVDVLYASLKREFITLNGSDEPKNREGSVALLNLE